MGSSINQQEQIDQWSKLYGRQISELLEQGGKYARLLFKM